MLTIYTAAERGYFNFGWLKTYHSFSFGEYYNPHRMGFRSLRVINEDFIQKGKGFPTHGHRDMEIITFVLEGHLEHKDSMGNGSTIGKGEIQYMSAGKGVTHSEFNPSHDLDAHIMQIWIVPNVTGAEPRYEQRTYTQNEESVLLAGPEDSHALVKIRQTAYLTRYHLQNNKNLILDTNGQNFSYVHVMRGSCSLEGHILKAGDACEIKDQQIPQITGLEKNTELLCFNLA